MNFCEQQDIAHVWANRVFLSTSDCHIVVEELCRLFGISEPDLQWEMPGMLGGNQAATVRNPRAGGHTIFFEGLGTTLLVLCHELVHCVRPWDDPHHDELDFDLCTLMLETQRYAV